MWLQQSLYIGTDRPAITLFYVIFLGVPLKSFASDTALDHIFSQQCKSKQLLKMFLEKMDLPKNILQHSGGENSQTWGIFYQAMLLVLYLYVHTCFIIWIVILQTFGVHTMGVMAWLMPILIAISVCGTMNGCALGFSR